MWTNSEVRYAQLVGLRYLHHAYRSESSLLRHHDLSNCKNVLFALVECVLLQSCRVVWR
jgi:hypothetical protein